MAGGSLGVNTQKNEGNPDPNPIRSSSTSFWPSLGVFVRDNLAVGVRAGYGGSTYGFQNGEQKTRNTSADFFARKYLPLGKGFYLFGEGSIGYFRNKMETESASGTQVSAATTNGVSLSAYPGISYAVSRRLQLEAGLSNLLHIGYSTSRYEYAASQTGSISRSSGFNAGIGVGASIPLNLGFRLFFRK